jgi:hypothetical protein
VCASEEGAITLGRPGREEEVWASELRARQSTRIRGVGNRKVKSILPVLSGNAAGIACRKGAEYASPALGKLVTFVRSPQPIVRESSPAAGIHKPSRLRLKPSRNSSPFASSGLGEAQEDRSAGPILSTCGWFFDKAIAGRCGFFWFSVQNAK